MALLLFPSKFGVQEVERFSQSPGDFGLGHLNVPYMTVQYGVRSEEIVNRIYRGDIADMI